MNLLASVALVPQPPLLVDIVWAGSDMNVLQLRLGKRLHLAANARNQVLHLVHAALVRVQVGPVQRALDQIHL